jgi:hypothetical protein
MINVFRFWVRRVSVAAVATGASVLAPHVASAQVTCTDSFSNLFALTNIDANARTTFAYSSGFNASGKIDLCPNSSNGVCWTYRHRCLANYVLVDDISGYGHFHLSFTDPGFAIAQRCGFYDPHDGYGGGLMKIVNGVCVQPDWTREPRVANGHDANQWIAITMADDNASSTVFDMPRIRVGGTKAIQLWYHSVIDDNWYGWDSLAPNNWNTWSLTNTDEVELSGADGFSTPTWEIDDFDLVE